MELWDRLWKKSYSQISNDIDWIIYKQSKREFILSKNKKYYEREHICAAGVTKIGYTSCKRISWLHGI